MEKKTNIERDALLAFYSTTCSEVTRYRDREWHNLAFFIAGIAAIIGFVLTKENIAKQHAGLFDVAFVVLFVGNIFYSSFAHDRLTIHRNIKRRLDAELDLGALGISGFDVLTLDEAKLLRIRQGWMRGFGSHLLPFFLAGGALAAFGMWLIHRA